MLELDEPESGDLRPYALGRGEGTSIWSLGALMTLKATAVESGAGITVIEQVVDRRVRPPLHRHRNEDEVRYVLDGRVAFAMGEEHVETRSGDFLFLPRRRPHGFAVRSARARMLVLFLPSGLEEFFKALGEPAAGVTLPPSLPPPDGEAVSRLAERYGCEILGPPLELPGDAATARRGGERSRRRPK